MANLSADNTCTIPCDYVEWPFSFDHGTTDVTELPFIVIKWHYIEKREWLPLRLLAGKHYYHSHPLISHHL